MTIRQYKILGKRVSRKQRQFVPLGARNTGVISLLHMGLKAISLENTVFFVCFYFTVIPILFFM